MRELLLPVAEGVDTRRTAQRLYVEMSRRRESTGVDLVVTTPERFEARRESLGSIYREVARDGRELYGAA